MFNNYAKSMFRNIYNPKQEGTGLKILISKQILQRLRNKADCLLFVSIKRNYEKSIQ